MRRNMPPLNHLRALEAAVRNKSFTKAAEELHVTQGAISRHVRALEEYLGFDLVERVNNTLLIPSESLKFAEALTQAFNNIHDATQELKEGRRRYVIVVRAYTNFTLRWLIPRLPGFQRTHPGLEIRISAGRNDTNFETDEVDIAVRYGLGSWSDVQGELLFADELLPVCSPKLAKLHRFEQPRDLLQATLYHSYQRRREWARWLEVATNQPLVPEKEVYLEDQAVVHQCLLAGMGVGLAQRHYIEDDVRAGRLVVPFGIPLRNPEGYYIISPPGRPERPAVEAFRDWALKEAQSSAVPVFGGPSVRNEPQLLGN